MTIYKELSAENFNSNIRENAGLHSTLFYLYFSTIEFPRETNTILKLFPDSLRKKKHKPDLVYFFTIK